VILRFHASKFLAAIGQLTILVQLLIRQNSLSVHQIFFLFTGIGYDFIPNVLERSLVDEWIKTSDRESFLMARRLIRDEGLLCGGSSGAAMVAAIKVAKRYKKGQRVVVLLADGVRNYMSKHLRDDWMIEHLFMNRPNSFVQSTWWTDQTIACLELSTPLTVTPNVTCAECVDILNSHDFDQMPCVDEHGAILGMVTAG